MLPQEAIPAGPVVLRLPTEGDADQIARACSDPEIARFIPFIPSPYTWDDALTWITKTLPAMWENGGAGFIVADPGTDEVLGTAGLQPPDRFGASEVGYWLAPWARGRGVATAAVRTLAERAFALGVSRIALLANVENVASQQVALRSGFAYEGVLRGAGAPWGAGPADIAAFGRLSTDPGDPITPFLPFFPGGASGGSLTDGVVRLTPLTTADTADYFALASVPDVMDSHVPPRRPAYAGSELVCRYTRHRWLTGQRLDAAIRDARTGEFAGDIQLTGVVPDLGQAMLGYSLLPAFRGRGLVTRAVNLLVGWAFERTPLRRIVAGTTPGNTASHRVLERAGFTREHLVRGLLPGPGDTRVDDLQWARTRD
ncbi:GNAT N-acetyltransferase [Microbispora cellulosiformans]|uniref:GNAT N-acetyltransferase n=1 Tax=Microbispora cellulosiformans TaxID=2614688 RepID=A0A5J5K084_9ACTN|nr:GNAT family N-acetyltransferase [Microbispora cellulosiformans]KAA9377552.1 GNAT N-acetyltransferase [Microbispora cellulosiformans]